MYFIETLESVKEIPGLPADHSGDELVEFHHEMAADMAGEVVELLAEDAEGVERGRMLFRVWPEAL